LTEKKMMRHLKAVLSLPFIVAVLLPFLLYVGNIEHLFPLIEKKTFFPYRMVIGFPLVVIGLYIFIVTNKLFATIGKGTLAPWDPTQKMVIEGPYRYCRNPMISAVLFIIVGESFLLASLPILIWAVVFFVMTNIYFILSEEPELEKRFGKEFLDYKANVPRWIPRLRPWKGEKGRAA